MKILVSITGASGAPYALRLLDVLEEKGIEVHCVCTPVAKEIIKEESGFGGAFCRKCYDSDDIQAPFSSGSYPLDAEVIIPCSMKTLAAIASGYASNLITRTADVMLKQRKELIIVPRETPLNSVHLENMLKLSKIGAVILPAMPAFYNGPKNIEDMVDFIVGKILDSLGIENKLYRRWKAK